MKLLLSFLCAMFCGCAQPPIGHITARPPQGALFAYVKVTGGLFDGRRKGDTGFFFYVENEPGIAGPVLSGYQYQNGELRDVFGGGSDSEKTVKVIAAVGFEPFDFKSEVELVVDRLTKEAEIRGKSFRRPQVLDGAEYEIRVVTTKGDFVLREWNPGYEIEFFATHSDKIAKLKSVIDLLALDYGHLKFGI
jgi:hypothetical protein